jgi:hypothetical protein
LFKKAHEYSSALWAEWEKSVVTITVAILEVFEAPYPSQS